MIKKLAPSNRVDNTLDFLSAPKRKREDSIDLIFSSRQQDNDVDDDFVFPSHKRSASSNRLCRTSFSLSSCDSEAREGPADDVLDDETEALVKNFRTSIFRYEPPSPSSIASPYKEEADEEEDHCIDYFPSIGRATTISDSSESDDEYSDPPDMAGSRPVSPHAVETLEQDDVGLHHDEHAWSSSSPSLDYHRRRDDDKDPIEVARERPEWLSGTPSPRWTLSATTPSEPSPLWMTFPNKGSSSGPANWTGMFHQGSA